MRNIILVARCLRHLAFYENKIEDSSDADLDRYVAKLKSFLLSDQVKSFNRSQHTKWLNGSHLINDSYNANPASMKAALYNFNNLKIKYPEFETVVILSLIHI